jgi:hypothetical protein
MLCDAPEMGQTPLSRHERSRHRKTVKKIGRTLGKAHLLSIQ